MHSTSTENISVSEVLSGEITNWQVGENNLGSTGDNLVQFTVNNVPLSIDNLLEVIWVFDSNLGVVFLSLELELDVQDGDLWVEETLWLLLETGIGESLLESNTLNCE